ncbi:MAG TPA: S8 family serine peptidase, partial [Gemmatimonadaceae bacterium]
NALIIASSGNSPTTTPNYPAAYPEVVSVAALGPDYSLASYSTIGSTVDLVAPGGDFRFGIGSGGVASSTWNYVTDEANYTYYEGTSMAAPHVAGVAALVLAANPGLTPAQLRVRLEAGAIDLGPPGRDNRYGWGVVNAFNSITGRTSAATSTLVSAVDATTGAVARTVSAGADGGFSLTRLPAGSYFVVAGQDEANDKRLGIPGRRFSWSGAPALASVPLTATSLQSIAIGLGAPVEIEPNNDAGSAQMLVIDSWVAGQITAPDVRDVYQFIVPAAGTYTVETSGVLGSCGNALELDTRLRLLEATGVEVANNDDMSFPTASYPGSYCSRISTTLQPGRYTVEVLATSLVKSGVNTQGQYRLHIRSGA